MRGRGRRLLSGLERLGISMDSERNEAGGDADAAGKCIGLRRRRCTSFRRKRTG